MEKSASVIKGAGLSWNVVLTVNKVSYSDNIALLFSGLND
jgi:hypothetical protein